MKKKENDNSNNIIIKKKSLIISLVLVSFVSIILVIASIVSQFTFTSGLSAVNAQREPPPKSPSQSQTEKQQEQEQKQKQKQLPSTQSVPADRLQCDDIIKALIKKGLGGVSLEKNPLNPIFCPNGLAILLKLPLDVHAIGQLCSPQSRQVMLDFLQEVNSIRSGSDLRCSPCEATHRGTTCPGLLSMLGTYSCANENNNDHCLTCGNECNTAEGESCTSRGCETCVAGQIGCRNCVEGTYFSLSYNRCVEECNMVGDQTNLPPDGHCGCIDPSLTACGLKCTDTQNDPLNCGGCAGGLGVVCSEDEICRNGKCEAGTCSAISSVGISATAMQECNGQCTDLSNPETCGTSCDDIKQCETPVGGTATCNNGQCSGTCPSGLEVCNGQCVNMVSDNHNCGACGNNCAQSFARGSFCDFGECKCLDNQEVFNGLCVDKCPIGQSRDPVTGDCVLPCPSGSHFEICSANPMDRGCVPDGCQLLVCPNIQTGCILGGDACGGIPPGC